MSLSLFFKQINKSWSFVLKGRRDLVAAFSCSKGGCREEPESSQGCTAMEWEAMDTNYNKGNSNSLLRTKSPLSQQSDIGSCCSERLCSVSPWAFSELSRTRSWARCCKWTWFKCGAGWDELWKVPSKLNWFLILWESSRPIITRIDLFQDTLPLWSNKYRWWFNCAYHGTVHGENL